MSILGRKNASKEPKVLDVDASLQGNLVFKDAVQLRINGSFDGNLETKGDLFIGDHATVKANIIGERITIAGTLQGDVTALTELKLTSTARVSGNIKTPTLEIEKGGIFHGSSRMLADAENHSTQARRVLFGVDEVAHYLSVEKNLIAEWAETGKLPASRDGEVWRFEKQKVDEWIANGRVA